MDHYAAWYGIGLDQYYVVLPGSAEPQRKGHFVVLFVLHAEAKIFIPVYPGNNSTVPRHGAQWNTFGEVYILKNS